jgi:hypothetical protein
MEVFDWLNQLTSTARTWSAQAHAQQTPLRSSTASFEETQ